MVGEIVQVGGEHSFSPGHRCSQFARTFSRSKMIHKGPIRLRIIPVAQFFLPLHRSSLLQISEQQRFFRSSSSNQQGGETGQLLLVIEH